MAYSMPEKAERMDAVLSRINSIAADAMKVCEAYLNARSDWRTVRAELAAALDDYEKVRERDDQP